MDKTCPKCGLIKDIATGFGYRKVPHPIPQSWCRVCRNKRLPASMKPIYNKESIRIKYAKEYPNDKANLSRSLNFMMTKLKREGYFA